jgi:hypothetical protein
MKLKHKFAENYRGLYNNYIYSLVDKVNENYNIQIQFNENLNDSSIEDLEKYVELVNKTDNSFEFLYSETNKFKGD